MNNKWGDLERVDETVEERIEERERERIDHPFEYKMRSNDQVCTLIIIHKSNYILNIEYIGEGVVRVKKNELQVIE